MDLFSDSRVVSGELRFEGVGGGRESCRSSVGVLSMAWGYLQLSPLEGVDRDG